MVDMGGGGGGGGKHKKKLCGGGGVFLWGGEMSGKPIQHCM